MWRKDTSVANFCYILLRVAYIFVLRFCPHKMTSIYTLFTPWSSFIVADAAVVAVFRA